MTKPERAERGPFPKRLVVIPALIVLAVWLWPSGSKHYTPPPPATDAAGYRHAFREVAATTPWWPHVRRAEPVDTDKGGIYVTVTTDLSIGPDGKAADPALAHRICAAAVGSVDRWKAGHEKPGDVSAVVEGPEHAFLASCSL